VTPPVTSHPLVVVFHRTLSSRRRRRRPRRPRRARRVASSPKKATPPMTIHNLVVASLKVIDTTDDEPQLGGGLS